MLVREDDAHKARLDAGDDGGGREIMMQDSPVLSPEVQAAITAEIQALMPELWGVLGKYSSGATMAALATTAACMIMSEPDLADANITLFFAGVMDRITKLRLFKIDLGGLPN